MKHLHLLLPQFHFVQIGKRGKFHVESAAHSFTLCGRDLQPEAQMPERQVELALVCGRCFASVRTFQRGVMYEVSER